MSAIGPLETHRARWVHTEPDLLAVSESALARCATRSWAKDALRDRELRALIIRTVLAAADISGEPPIAGSVVEVPDLSTVVFLSAEHRTVAASLLRTIRVLALDQTPAFPVVITTQGKPATYAENEAAGWPWAVAGVVAIAGIAAYCYSTVFVAEQTTYVSDRAFKRKDTGDKLMETHATLLKLVEAHAQAERDAGQSLPFNPAEKAAFAMLASEQEAFLASFAGEAPTKPPKQPGAGWFGFGLALPMVALGALLFFKGDR